MPLIRAQGWMMGMAVSSAAPVGNADNRSSPVALEVSLARCQRQLGDWTACPSGKTPEGHKIIEKLQSQIATLEARIADNAKVSNTWRPASQLTAQSMPTTVALGSPGALLSVFA